jgi:glycosyltransferase involved in cell wall biosynthesis
MQAMHLRLITSTPLNVSQGSGTFVGITALVRSLRARGATVDLITPTFRLPIYTLQRLLFNAMLRFHRRTNYDVTVGFDMDGYTLAGACPGIYISSIKGVIADEMRFESGLTKATMRVQAACEKLNVNRANFVITTSRYAAAKIQEFYGVSNPPLIIPEMIDLQAWNEQLLLNPADPDPRNFVVLSVCRFYPRKRLHILLGAAQRLRGKIPELEISIVGGGPEAKRLKESCREKGLQSVVNWKENISQAELAREYNRCHVFCLPSVQEGFGIVFLEAMASGKAIVAANAGATPEVAKQGVLVQPDNELALANAIESLYREPALRNSLGEAGRQFVAQFDAPVVAELFLREIEKLAGLPAAAGGEA